VKNALITETAVVPATEVSDDNDSTTVKNTDQRSTRDFTRVQTAASILIENWDSVLVSLVADPPVDVSVPLVVDPPVDVSVPLVVDPPLEALVPLVEDSPQDVVTSAKRFLNDV